MGRKLEKGKSGEAVQYYSRKQAMRHLQIGLPNFIRLCLWKGIYPSQPTNIRAVTKGDSKQKIYYKRKDINLLLHEPVLEKLREMRAFQVKLKRALERKDRDKAYRLRKTRPRYTLHHIIRELYPTRDDALRNLDDCLKSVFLFATLPKMTQFPSAFIAVCRRLKLEFLNYCIAKQALTRCFISVKGFYLEVELTGGSPARWLVPHQHVAMSLPPSCDYRLLANQMEFDCTLLASLLKNMYTEAGLDYPPKFELPETSDGTELSDSDVLAAMSFPLASNAKDTADNLEWVARFRDMDEQVAAVADKVTRRATVQSLFRGQRVFLNREVPREIFCFVLRSCGAEVSWDVAGGAGDVAPFNETDESITLQIVDRPLAPSAMRVTRSYVQPQWVFDCVNAARLLPVKDYLPGARLIAHLSPFVDYSTGYVPPELRYLRGEIDAAALLSGTATVAKRSQEESHDNEDGVEDELEQMDNDMGMAVEERESDSCSNSDDDEEEETKEKTAVSKKPQQPRRPREEVHREAEAAKQVRLLEMALPKKRLNLYKKMKHAEKARQHKVTKLSEKRREADSKKRQQQHQ